MKINYSNVLLRICEPSIFDSTIKRNEIMTNLLSIEETENLKKLERRLSSKGLTISEWSVVEVLRSKRLLSQGLNPKDWTLDGYVVKRKGFITGH